MNWEQLNKIDEEAKQGFKLIDQVLDEWDIQELEDVCSNRGLSVCRFKYKELDIAELTHIPASIILPLTKEIEIFVGNGELSKPLEAIRRTYFPHAHSITVTSQNSRR